MKRRIVWPALIACVSLTGCELLRHGQRPDADKPFEPTVEPKVYGDDPEVSTAPKGFFKSSRLPGALSDEGREIENHLGIH